MPTPYVTYDGNTREAFAFYERALGGKIEFLQTNGETPMRDHIPPENHDLVMHATIVINGERLMASDAGPWAPYQGPMRSCALSLHYTSVDEGRKAFDALSEGGEVVMPFDKTFWAAGFGMVNDRFGVAWMVNVNEP